MEKIPHKDSRSTIEKKSITQLEAELKRLDEKKVAYKEALKRKKDRERKQQDKALKYRRQQEALKFLKWAEDTKMPKINKFSGTIFDFYSSIKNGKDITNTDEAQIERSRDSTNNTDGLSEKEGDLKSTSMPILNQDSIHFKNGDIAVRDDKIPSIKELLQMSR